MGKHPGRQRIIFSAYPAPYTDHPFQIENTLTRQHELLCAHIPPNRTIEQRHVMGGLNPLVYAQKQAGCHGIMHTAKILCRCD